jgi:hypothetical protein
LAADAARGQTAFDEIYQGQMLPTIAASMSASIGRGWAVLVHRFP